MNTRVSFDNESPDIPQKVNFQNPLNSSVPRRSRSRSRRSYVNPRIWYTQICVLTLVFVFLWRHTTIMYAFLHKLLRRFSAAHVVLSFPRRIRPDADIFRKKINRNLHQTNVARARDAEVLIISHIWLHYRNSDRNFCRDFALLRMHETGHVSLPDAANSNPLHRNRNGKSHYVARAIRKVQRLGCKFSLRFRVIA